jgi:opacity protein-like surface antigen
MTSVARVLVVLGVALAAAVSVSPARAADIPVEQIVEEAQSLWYVSLHGGWKFDEKWDDDLDASHGDPGSDDFAELTVRTEDGWRVGGAIGYAFSSWLAVEGELGYMTQDFDSVVFDEASGEFTDLEGLEFDVDGDTSIFTGMINAILGMPIGGVLRPYVGVGVGGAIVDIDAAVTDLDFSLADSDTVLAAQAFAGIDISISENLAIGGRVRYLHLDDIEMVDAEDHDHSIDPDGIISAEAVLTIGLW